MTISQTDIIGKIRKSIDDIAPLVADSFVTDINDELWQAVEHACTELSMELPINLLDVTAYSVSGTVDPVRGLASVQLPTDHLRFVSLDIAGWEGAVRELIEPGSDAEKMQRSAWSRGTATKPKAMIDHDSQGNKTIVWWPGDNNHKTGHLDYIKAPQVVADSQSSPTTYSINSAIRQEAEQLVIWRAASIFFEGKKEDTIAEKFRTLSNNY